MTNTHPITVGGIVLCGGRSTRMERPKLSLPFGSRTMLERVVQILGDVVAPVVVVAAAGQDVPQLPDGVLLARDEHDDRGPLEGLAVGLSLLKTSVDAAFVTPCDAPLLKPEFVQRMIDLLGPHELTIPRDGKFHHPLAAVYRTSLADKVRSLVDQNRLRPFFLVEECDSKIVDVDELRDVDPKLDSLRNTNTPQDYRDALTAAGYDAD